MLPSGRRVWGRGLRTGPPEVEPDFGLYLLPSRPTFAWPSTWIRWRDFWVPSDFVAAREALVETYGRLEVGTVEVACGGGKGRTGTALACLAVLEGLPAPEAVAFVRAHYEPRAIETPWQRRWVERFAGSLS